MSNLQNFLEYKQSCVHCSKPLNFEVRNSSGSILNNVKLQFIDDGICLLAERNAFPAPKNKKKFEIQYSINYHTNDFIIDFPKNGENKKYLSLDNIDDSKSFTKNTNLVFYRVCQYCYRYGYNSSMLYFDYKNGKIRGIFVKNEIVYLSKNIDNILKYYTIYNDYADKKTVLSYDNKIVSELENKLQLAMQHALNKNLPNKLDLPLIMITSPQDLLKIIDIYITFS